MAHRLGKILPEKKDKDEYYCTARSHEHDRLKDEYKLIISGMVYAYNMIDAIAKFSAMYLNSKVDYKSVYVEKTGCKE